MKRVSTFFLLIVFALGIAWSMPAFAERENRRIGENGIEAKKAAKHQQKLVNKNAKKQRKAMKKAQKAQRKAAKNTRYRTR